MSKKSLNLSHVAKIIFWGFFSSCAAHSNAVYDTMLSQQLQKKWKCWWPRREAGHLCFSWGSWHSNAEKVEQSKEQMFAVTLVSRDSGCFPKKAREVTRKRFTKMWWDIHNKELGVFLCPDQWDTYKALTVSQSDQCDRNWDELKQINSLQQENQSLSTGLCFF
jgi:hypothetical protein